MKHASPKQLTRCSLCMRDCRALELLCLMFHLLLRSCLQGVIRGCQDA
uniref:Uncharacterized protein n=1 Tax=Arundo donax TaxID=35708 RepID=A0A0A9DN70_ARUDO